VPTITYKPNPGRLLGRRILGGFLAVGGGCLGFVVLLAGVLTLPLFLQADNAHIGARLLGFMLPLTGLAFIIAFVGAGALLAFSHTGDRVHLTSDSIIYAQRKISTTLPLHEIIRVQGKFIHNPRGAGHWVLSISGRSGDSIELDIGRPGYLATFDVMPIAKELLPRLPAAAEIDPRIRGYAASGQFPS
jgi:hypothetical protein